LARESGEAHRVKGRSGGGAITPPGPLTRHSHPLGGASVDVQANRAAVALVRGRGAEERAGIGRAVQAGPERRRGEPRPPWGEEGGGG